MDENLVKEEGCGRYGVGMGDTLCKSSLAHGQ